jgi:excisionase family DNA binding protein
VSDRPPLGFRFPDSFVGEVADRVAELLAERFAPRASSPYLTVDEAAEFLRAKPHRVYDLLSSGRLTRHKDGSRVLVERAELEAWVSGALDQD